MKRMWFLDLCVLCDDDLRLLVRVHLSTVLVSIHSQGYDGRLKRFCISCVRPDQYQYPRAHTCFNRLDLPNYPTEAELRQKMSLVINLEHEFGIE